MLANVTWGEVSAGCPASSENELVGLLARLNKNGLDRPFIANVSISNGDTLSIALGRDLSILSFRQASLDPPYYVSAGAIPGAVAGVVNFDYFGSYSEFPLWQTIPTIEAIEAVKQFAVRGTLPDSVTWTEV